MTHTDPPVSDTGHNGFSGADLRVEGRPHMRPEDVPARVAVQIAEAANRGAEFIVIRTRDWKVHGTKKVS